MITSEKTTKPAAWKGFKGGHWQEEINIRDFIQNNFTQYNGDESFLAGPTAATKTLNDKVLELKKQERAAGGVLDADTKVVATITSHGPGYIQKDLEKIVGLQTDKPLKRAFMPFGGIRMADDALKSNCALRKCYMHQCFLQHQNQRQILQPRFLLANYTYCARVSPLPSDSCSIVYTRVLLTKYSQRQTFVLAPLL